MLRYFTTTRYRSFHPIWRSQGHSSRWNEHWVNPTLLDFSNWLKEKAEAHNLMKNNAINTKTEDTSNPLTRKICVKGICCKYATKWFSKPQQSAALKSVPSCIVCKGSYLLWESRVLNEKTPTQWAKVLAEAKLCFFWLRNKLMFRQCPSPWNSMKDGCNSSQNTILHGAEKVIPTKPTNSNNLKSSVVGSKPSSGQ